MNKRWSTQHELIYFIPFAITDKNRQEKEMLEKIQRIMIQLYLHMQNYMLALTLEVHRPLLYVVFPFYGLG